MINVNEIGIYIFFNTNIFDHNADKYKMVLKIKLRCRT